MCVCVCVHTRVVILLPREKIWMHVHDKDKMYVNLSCLLCEVLATKVLYYYVLSVCSSLLVSLLVVLVEVLLLSIQYDEHVDDDDVN